MTAPQSVGICPLQPNNCPIIARAQVLTVRSLELRSHTWSEIQNSTVCVSVGMQNGTNLKCSTSLGVIVLSPDPCDRLWVQHWHITRWGCQPCRFSSEVPTNSWFRIDAPEVSPRLCSILECIIATTWKGRKTESSLKLLLGLHLCTALLHAHNLL